MKIDICECACHRKNESILHCVPCCQMTYAKYINDDGSFDWVEVGKAIRRAGIRIKTHTMRNSRQTTIMDNPCSEIELEESRATTLQYTVHHNSDNKDVNYEFENYVFEILTLIPFDRDDHSIRNTLSSFTNAISRMIKLMKKNMIDQVDGIISHIKEIGDEAESKYKVPLPELFLNKENYRTIKKGNVILCFGKKIVYNEDTTRLIQVHEKFLSLTDE